MMREHRIDRGLPLLRAGARRSTCAARRRRPARHSARRWRCRSWPAPCPCSTAWCGRTASRRASPAGVARPSSGWPRSRPRTAVPKPYQPGSIRRHCAQLNTQGMARRSSMPCRFERDAGRLPILRRRDLLQHRRFAEVGVEALGLVDQRAIGAEGVAPTAPPSRRDSPRAAAAARPRSRLASSVAAARVSRLRRPTSALEYLPAITSPCSVTRICALHGAGRLRQDRLVARPAAAADRAAAAVEQAQPDLDGGGTPRSAPARPCRAPRSRSGSRRPCCCRNSPASPPGCRRARRAAGGRPAGRTAPP